MNMIGRELTNIINYLAYACVMIKTIVQLSIIMERVVKEYNRYI